jgi:uncharacterized protein (TIGR02099 family)
MIRLLRSFAAKVWLALILLTILGGIAILVVRLLLPMVDQYRPDAEKMASEMLGRQVEISKLSARWRGFGPELVLEDMRLINPETGQPSFQLEAIHVGISLFDALRSEEIKPREITFYGASLLIKRRSDGSVVVSGLEGVGESGDGDSGELFFLPYHIALKESELYWENQAIGAAPLRFVDVEIVLRNDGDRHQLDALLSLPDNTDAKMKLAADIRGELNQPGAWSGDFYLHGDKLPLAKLLGERLPEGYTINSGTAAMEIWSHWQKGYLHSTQGEIHWHDLDLEGLIPGQEQSPRQLQLTELGGHFKWQRTTDGWRLGMADIEVKRNGRGWPSSKLEVEGHFDQEGYLHLRSGIGFLRVEDIITLGRMFPLPTAELDQALAAIQPQADIYDLQFRFDDTPEGPRWTGRGRFEDLSVQPWRGAPGIENLDARFWLTHDRGEMDLRSKVVSTEFPDLFRDTLQLQEVSGLLSWERQPELGWVIKSNELEANNNDVKTRTRLRMELPFAEESSPHLDLQTDFRDGEVSTASRYLPVGIMAEGVVEWLDRSLIGGRLVSGSCVFRGPLRDFPFEKRSTGRFEVLFGVEDLLLDYWPEWPRAEEITAEIRFLDNRFDAWMESGEILGSTLQNVHGRIERLSEASPFRLSGRVTGPLQDKLQLLSESPLREHFAPLTETIRTEGEANLNLDFSIPISTRRKDPFSLDGVLTFKDSAIHVDEWQLSVNQINGKLLFDQNSVRSKELQGQLLGTGASIKVAPIKGKSGSTRITARAKLPIETLLARHLPNLGLKDLKGTTDWQLQLDIPPFVSGKKPTVGLRLSSSLRGIKLDQPAPIGKSKEQSRKLVVTTRLTDQTRRRLGIRYGNLLDTALLLKVESSGKIGFLRGGLQFGGARAQLPEENLMLIGGRLDNLHVDPWISYIESSGVGLEIPKITTKDLQVKELRYGDTRVQNLTFNMSADKAGAHGQIEGDKFAGSFQLPIPLQDKPVTMRLNRLHLDYNPEEIAEIPQQEKDTSWADPRTLPAIDLQSEKFILNGRDYGQLTLLTRRTPEGVALDVISLISERLKLSARGEWIIYRGNAQTAIEFTMDAQSLGKLLDHLGYAPNLRRAPAKVEADLRWSGNPRQFSSTDLNGEIKMDVGEGRFREVDPGLGRIFGLLNLSALQRRLSLDFSDLFKKGFSFDHMQGTFSLEEGDAYTNDLQIKGPAANIEIAGRIGLVDQDFDQLVTVTPEVSASLPIAGAVAGGPAVGAAVYLAQKVLGKRVDRVTNILYTVKGPWDNPTITRQEQKLESRLSTFFELEETPADALDSPEIPQDDPSPWENPFLTPQESRPE